MSENYHETPEALDRLDILEGIETCQRFVNAIHDQLSLADDFERQVRAERVRQEKLHGETNRKLSLAQWLSVLMEEIGSLAKAANQRSRDEQIQELIHVAAVCKAIAHHWFPDRF